jgi:hypothetical protein
MRTFAFAALTVVVLAVPARAQEALPPGETHREVRVRLGSDEVVRGFLRGRSTDEVVVFTPAGQYRRVPLADVRSFEVRSRNGTQMGRGALIGVLIWGSVMATGAVDRLDDAGFASWESGALLLGAAGVGAAIGHGVPRYGWVPADPRRAAAPAFPRSLVQVSFRF